MRALRSLFVVLAVALSVAFAPPCGAVDNAADNGITVATSPPEGTVGTTEGRASPWAALPPSPVAVSRPAGAVVGGRFFVIGGEESGGARNGYVQAYDPISNTWTNTRMPMPTGVSNLCAGVINDKVYVPGGFTGSSGLTDLQIYDPGLDSWTVDATDPMPSARFGNACTEYNGKLYVFGGNDGAVTTNTTYIYDPLGSDGNRWTTGASAPFTGQYGAAIAAGAHVFYAGLYEAGDTADVMRYDPALDSWTLLPSLTTARGGAQMWTFEGNLVVGGGGWGTYLTSTEVYDLSSGIGGSWSPGNALVTGRRTFAGAQDDVNSLIYAGCGWAGAFVDAADIASFIGADLIFADGFESGNTNPWSATSP